VCQLKVLAAAVALLLSGCGFTVGYMAECLGPACHDDPEIEYYQAVKADAAMWNLPEEEGQIPHFRWVQRPILAVDFVISAVVDTALLPFQAALNALRPGSENAGR